jgi:hypothetical protein
MQSGQDDLRMNLTKPLPVLIVYMKAAVRENGDVYFYRDIYGYDAELQDASAKTTPIPGSREHDPALCTLRCAALLGVISLRHIPEALSDTRLHYWQLNN